MANLAIKGHKERGKEVIEILKMLGGINNPWGGENPNWIYCLCDDTVFSNHIKHSKSFQVFSLEEFLERYPYKVGDKVMIRKYNDHPHTIKALEWNGEKVVYLLTDGIKLGGEDLQPFEKHRREEHIESPALNSTIEDEFIKMNIPEGYKFSGVDDDNQQVVFEKIGCQYPKTYEECCKILSLGEDSKLYTKGYNAHLIQQFHKLLICRDAYWKIAGEEMGLGKPWKPSYRKWDEYVDGGKLDKYTIIYDNNEVHRAMTGGTSYILTFPTEEVRDVFYESFKDLIEICCKLY